jgi:hypothetical protein
MTTIDKLDISIYDLYAKRQVMVEQINQQFRLQEAHDIPPQTQVMNLNPELTQLDILLGVVPLNTPWAYFFPPKRKLRRSPFSSFRVASSLGSLEDQAALFDFILSIPCQSAEEEEEKQSILQCFKQLDILNEWMGFIFGRKGQFLQG